MEWIDTHIHLDDEVFRQDLEAVLARAGQAGVGQMINAAASRETAPRVLALAQRYPALSAGIGLHPHEFNTGPLTAADQANLKRQLCQARVVAAGEIGLDYHAFPNYPAPNPAAQREAFEAQLALAQSHELPVILHVREAYPDALEILKRQGPFPAGGVMHCYAGGTAYLREVLDLGLHIGIGGTLTYPKSEDLRRAVRDIPEDRLLLETDAPYLPPQSKRGQRHEPAWMVEVGAALGQCKGWPLEAVAEITTRNARRLFRLAPGAAGIVTYAIRGRLYVNLTNRCSAHCGFCPRLRHRRVEGYALDLAREPEAGEIVAAIGDPGRWEEIVFCGYGEPTLRWPTLLAVAQAVKPRARAVRVNTNGHGELLYGTDLLEEAKGWIDAWSVSLNSADPGQYRRLVSPALGEAAFPAVQAFIRKAVQAGFQVTASAVDVPGVDEAAVQRMAEHLGARFRSREYEHRDAQAGA